MRVPKDYWILIQLTCSLHLKVTTTYYIWWWYSGTCLAATSLLRPPHYHGHLVITATLLLQPPRYYGHLVITATSLLQPPRYYGHLVIMATLFWSRNKLSEWFSYLKKPFNTSTLFWPDHAIAGIPCCIQRKPPEKQRKGQFRPLLLQGCKQA